MRCCGLSFGRSKDSSPQKEVVVEKHYIPVQLPGTNNTSVSVPKVAVRSKEEEGSAQERTSKEGESETNQAIPEAASTSLSSPEKSTAAAAPPTEPTISAKEVEQEEKEKATLERSSAVAPENTAISAAAVQREEAASPEKSTAIAPEQTAISAADVQAEEAAKESRSTSTTTNEAETTWFETMTDQLKGAASGLSNTVQSGAQQASSTLSSGAQTAQSSVTSGAEKAASTVQNPSSVTQGTQDWDAMTEEQKKQAFDSLPSEQKEGLTYYEWIKQGYYHQKENWMPWIEDQYLKWFTKDNKTSYATKEGLDKTKVTGIEQVDTLQDSVNHTISGQVGQGGLLQPVGDMVSKEGVNRAERGGKDDGGSYLGAAGGYASKAGGSVWSGAKSAGGYVGGMFGGKKEEGAEAKQ